MKDDEEDQFEHISLDLPVGSGNKFGLPDSNSKDSNEMKIMDKVGSDYNAGSSTNRSNGGGEEPKMPTFPGKLSPYVDEEIRE